MVSHPTVLVLTDPTPDTDRLSQHLKDLGIAVVTYKTFAELTGTPVLMLGQGALPPGAGAHLSELRAQSPQLPWAAIDPTWPSGSAPSGVSEKPTVELRSQSSDLDKTVLVLLRAQLFPEALTGLLNECVRKTLHESYRSAAVPTTRGLRSSRLTSGGLSAMVSFSSAEITGCMALSADVGLIHRLNSNLGLAGAKVADLIGDATSQVAARLKTGLIYLGVQLRVGFPVVSEDPTLSLTYRDGRVSWTERFTGDGGWIEIELCLDHCEPTLFGRKPNKSVAVLEPGSMSFLDNDE